MKTNHPTSETALRPILVGVAGGSGCGKTYLAEQVAREAGSDHVAVISMDRYFRTEGSGMDPGTINFDHPSHLDIHLLVRHLRSLRAGKAVWIPDYDFASRIQSPRSERIQPRPVVIVEGLFLLADPIVRLFDLTCFLHVEADQRLLGRIIRDIKQRHASVEETVDRYQRFVRPSYQVFVEPTMQNADILVDFTYRRAFFAELLVHIIKDYVAGSLPMDELVHRVRSETYREVFEVGKGQRPIAADIFRLAKAYPDRPHDGAAPYLEANDRATPRSGTLE